MHKTTGAETTACWGKIAFSSRSKAQREIGCIMKRDKQVERERTNYHNTYDRRTHAHKLVVYVCDTCGAYHIGHTYEKKRTDREDDEEWSNVCIYEDGD